MAIKWSTGDKMVYGLPWLDETAIDFGKTAIGAIKWSTGDKMVYVDKTASGGSKMVYVDKTASGGNKIVYGR